MRMRGDVNVAVAAERPEPIFDCWLAITLTDCEAIDRGELDAVICARVRELVRDVLPALRGDVNAPLPRGRKRPSTS